MLNIALVFQTNGIAVFVANIFQDTKGEQQKAAAKDWWDKNRAQLLNGIAQGIIHGEPITRVMSDAVDIVQAGTGLETRFSLSDQAFSCVILPNP
ncbi:MAG: hypothetical protein DBY43_05690 [Clostridiaceae bacterium]|nr:MAG: hypothetical protein DBY43_05690 [Clostridiaceae bacterium]